MEGRNGTATLKRQPRYYVDIAAWMLLACSLQVAWSCYSVGHCPFCYRQVVPGVDYLTVVQHSKELYNEMAHW